MVTIRAAKMATEAIICRMDLVSVLTSVWIASRFAVWLPLAHDRFNLSVSGKSYLLKFGAD